MSLQLFYRMVLFSNVNVGQKVEVFHEGHIYCGKVKYKGTLNGVGGDWVGVELDVPGKSIVD